MRATVSPVQEPIVTQDPATLIACAQCDALHRDVPVPDGGTARCVRCGAILMAPRGNAVAAIVSLAAASMILMVVAVTAPFLAISAQGLSNAASVIDAVFAFSAGLMAPLSLTVAALIILLPAMRLSGLLYTVLPLAFGRPPWPQADLVFRASMRLQPWAMAEIFMIGVAVALIKLAGLAQVSFGPAFWAFAGLVVLTAIKDILMCERTIWHLLSTAPRS